MFYAVTVFNFIFGYAVTVSKFPNYSVMQLQFFFAGIDSAYCGRVIKEEQQIRDVKVRGTEGMRTMVETLSSYHGRACTR